MSGYHIHGVKCVLQHMIGSLWFCYFVTQICSMFSGKLLRFPGNSLFLSSFQNVWLLLNFISSFISLEKTVFSSYLDTKWMHLIYFIRNVFQQNNSIGAALISSLESQLTSLLCHSFTGMFLQNSFTEKVVLEKSRSLETHEDWSERWKSVIGLTTQHTVYTSETTWLLYVKCNLTVFSELDLETHKMIS